MAISHDITATASGLPADPQTNPTYQNSGSTRVYYRRSGSAVAFAGDAAALGPLAEGYIDPGESVAPPVAWGSMEAVCATGETGTLRQAAGAPRPFDLGGAGIMVAASDAQQWEKFQAALDRPAEDKRGLRELLQNPVVIDE